MGRPCSAPRIAAKALRAKHEAAFDGVDDAYLDVAALTYDLAFADRAAGHRWHLGSAPPQEQVDRCVAALGRARGPRTAVCLGSPCYGAIHAPFRGNRPASDCVSRFFPG